LPPADFNVCGVLPVDRFALSLEAAPNGSPSAFGSTLLTWMTTGAAPDEAEITTFLLQSAGDHQFAEVIEQLRLSAGELQVSIEARGTRYAYALPTASQNNRYIRVRAVQNDHYGLWSNPVRIDGDHFRPGQEETLGETPVDTELLALHLAAARFCRARQDLLGVLTLPAYKNTERIFAHLDALALTDHGRRPSTGQPMIFYHGVPTLSPGEGGALSYIALFHPWMALADRTTPNSTANENLGFIPCDGAICGTMAPRAIDAGAWVAAANIPLAGGLALQPVIDRDDWHRLAASGVNVIRQDPRGFVALNAHTLSVDFETRPINVRRLLILLRRLALRTGTRDVFEPHSVDFRNRVHHRFERLLTDLYVRGAFAGPDPAAGFRVVTDESVNTRLSMERGQFIVELRIAPARPLEFVTVRLVQTGPEQLFLNEL
ncbi:MAG: hypothetical protein ABFS02_14195, partial [Pseudomonadota bacterium]